MRVRWLMASAAVCLFGPAASTAWAGEATAASNKLAIDTIWVLVATVLVFIMQAGFAMLEVGFTRAKNACNIIMKNVMSVSVGSLVYWAVGFAVMFGASRSGLLGGSGFFLAGGDGSAGDGLFPLAKWMFQAVFCATAATIVSGAVAERIRFSAYLLGSVVITGLIYPVVGHWIWHPDGWLASMGMIDFAGSTVVHSVGGWAALAGALAVGPRTGKYVPEANGRRRMVSKGLPGHNIPLASLGVLLLWFGWFGFNAGSTLSGTDVSIARIAVVTNLAACAGSFGAMFTVSALYRKPDTSMTLNGALAGLVAITAGCASVSPASAVVIGAAAGGLVVVAVTFIDKVLGVDDPVGAVSVHAVCGTFGTLCVGLFAQEGYAGVNGLLFGGGLGQLGVQALGAVSVFAWAFGLALGVYMLLKATLGLRVSRAEEIRGLDIAEHGMEGYAGFQIFTTQ